MIKFGLREARMLAEVPDAHLPTVEVTLKILGVKNVVKEEVLRFTAAARAMIASANEKKTSILRNDAVDQKQVEEKVTKINTARATREAENTASVAKEDALIEAEKARIEELNKLADKFA